MLFNYDLIHTRENHGKKVQVHCPNCKGSNITGDSPIILMCRDCLWMGQIYEMLFEKEDSDE